MSESSSNNNSEQTEPNAEAIISPVEEIDHGKMLIKYFADLNISTQIVDYEWENKNSKFMMIDNQEVPLKYILRAVLFTYAKKNLLVITSMNEMIDYVVLCRELRVENMLCNFDELYLKYYDKDLSTYCPVAKYLNMPAIVELNMVKNKLNDSDQIFLPICQKGKLLKINAAEFFQSQAGFKLIDFHINIEEIHNKPDLQLSKDNIVRRMRTVSITEQRLKEKVNATFEMPVMPNMADQLLKLRTNPAANAHSLGKLVEQDPSLSAQLLSWARSPYYGYVGKITSVEEAIIKVLGFDLVMNISIGIAIGQIMNVSNEGKLGLLRHWRHSLYASSLIEMLIKKMPVAVRPMRGLAYLCGLLHNFGHLLLGQVFNAQFRILNQMILANPKVSILDIEYFLFDTDHQKIGAWLMKQWNMPEELIDTVFNHHGIGKNTGENIYANLVIITNRMLARYDIGDEFVLTEIPEDVLSNTPLAKEEIDQVFAEFWEQREGLDAIVDSFAQKSKNKK